MFHVKDGLFFKRNDDGSVTVLKTSDGKEPTDSNVSFTETLDDGSWCSAVLSMSAFSERPWRLACLDAASWPLLRRGAAGE